MCLYLNKIYQDKYEALRDIKVYKFLEISDGSYTSPYQGTFWKKRNSQGNVHKRIGGIKPDYFNIVEYGLHSFYVLNRSRGCVLRGPFIKMIEMVIPKGALFYVGNRGDIVSTELIWDEKRAKKAKNLTLKELP